MARKFNWSKTHYERKMREHGSAFHDDFLPRQPGGGKKNTSAALGSSKFLGSAKKKKRSKSEQQAVARQDYIKAVKKASVSGVAPPPPFRKLHPDIKAAIRAASSAEAWARAQPEYGEQKEAVPTSTVSPEVEVSKKWSAELSAEIAALEAELKEVNRRRNALRRDLEQKRKALNSLGHAGTNDIVSAHPADETAV